MRTWYFAFSNTGPNLLPGWVAWVTRGGFRHVRCFSQVDNHVLVVDPSYHRLELHIFSHPRGAGWPLPADLLALDCHARGETLVRITWPSTHDITMHHITNWFPGCVTVAKSVLGIADWVFTPSQFYQWLLSNGGELFTQERRDSVMTRVFGRVLADDELPNVLLMI